MRGFVWALAAVTGVLLATLGSREPVRGESPFDFVFTVAPGGLSAEEVREGLASADGSVGAAAFSSQLIPWTLVSQEAHRVGYVATTTLVIVISPDVRISRVCTGTLVGPNVVLTAAHCLTESGPVGAVAVAPGANSVADWQWPWGTALARGWTLPRGWVQERAEVVDLALLHLDDGAFPGHPGTYPTLATLPDDFIDHESTILWIWGYDEQSNRGRMGHVRGGTFAVSGPTFTHDVALDAASDGGPWQAWNTQIEEDYMAGIRLGAGGPGSRGLRFVPEHIEGLKEFCRLQSCTLKTIDRVNNPVPLPRPPIQRRGDAPLEPGPNQLSGPWGGDLPPSDFLACLDETDWSVLYQWAPGFGWRHFVNTALGIPAVANAPEAGGIVLVRRQEPGLILIGTDAGGSIRVRERDDDRQC